MKLYFELMEVREGFQRKNATSSLAKTIWPKFALQMKKCTVVSRWNNLTRIRLKN